MGGGSKAVDLFSFTSLLVNKIGKEQKYLPALQAHNFELFCGVDFLMDSFYWLPQEKQSHVPH